MPEQSSQITGQVEGRSQVDVEAQNKAINDILFYPVLIFFVVMISLFLFRKTGKKKQASGCNGCASSVCPSHGPEDGFSCHSAKKS
ncbi:hypothetical protein WJT86_04355 [Microvirga sp. W0021]|uniref:FeoB-associated Cys-rich membrane protein n=1 Tax=Hohaiivirga grylli TaxID=3133970 RepID=A0ABV0BH61_9HYPH